MKMKVRVSQTLISGICPSKSYVKESESETKSGKVKAKMKVKVSKTLISRICPSKTYVYVMLLLQVHIIMKMPESKTESETATGK